MALDSALHLPHITNSNREARNREIDMLPEDERRLQREEDIAASVRGPVYELTHEQLVQRRMAALPTGHFRWVNRDEWVESNLASPQGQSAPTAWGPSGFGRSANPLASRGAFTRQNPKTHEPER